MMQIWYSNNRFLKDLSASDLMLSNLQNCKNAKISKKYCRIWMWSQTNYLNFRTMVHLCLIDNRIELKMLKLKIFWRKYRITHKCKTNISHSGTCRVLNGQFCLHRAHSSFQWDTNKLWFESSQKLFVIIFRYGNNFWKFYHLCNFVSCISLNR